MEKTDREKSESTRLLLRSTPPFGRSAIQNCLARASSFSLAPPRPFPSSRPLLHRAIRPTLAINGVDPHG